MKNRPRENESRVTDEAADAPYTLAATRSLKPYRW